MSQLPAYRAYIDGVWQSARSGEEFKVFEPYLRKPFASVSACGGTEARAAIAAAARAFPSWAAVTPSEKAALFRKALEIVKRRRPEIADLLARETGSSISFATFQQGMVIEHLDHAASWAYRPKGELLQSDVPGAYSMSIKRPLGVVASFTPWNGANILAWRAVLSPLIGGNTVVVKPSEFAPISAGLIIAEIAEEAGFPPGVINVIPHGPGGATEIADEVFASRDTRCINLIGGVKTARLLAERAGKTLKRSVLELGGYNPLIVLDDVDIDYAVRSAVFGSFFHQGQVCMNTRKVIIQRKIYSEFLAKFIERTKTLRCGDPQDPKTVIGPLITPAAVQKVHEAVQEAASMGAVIRTGGKFEGQVYEPTILTDVSYSSRVSNEETFGPVVIVEPVDTEEDAITAANRVSYGLVSSILTSNSYRGLELAPRIQCGVVNVNSSTMNAESHVPMGGVRDSGWGRTGPDSVDDFMDVIWVNARSDQGQYPF